MKKTILAICAAISLTAVNASDLRIISAGSKTGSYSMQTIAYGRDLTGRYNVDTRIPGNFCDALAQIDDSTPTLFFWGHDFEAAYRSGKCSGVKYKLDYSQVVRSNRDSSLVCSMKYGKTDFLKPQASQNIGHTVPKELFTGVISNINAKFKTAHKSIPYNGNGSARLALLSGEVDYAMVTGEHGAFIKEKGGSCFLLLDTPSKLYAGIESLQQLVPNLNVSQSFDTTVYAINMNPDQKSKLVTALRAAHSQCDSAIGKYTKCDTVMDFSWTFTNVEKKRWETDVLTLVVK